MYDKRAEKRAEQCGILYRLQALENDLLKIDGISDIDFDIDTYGDYDVSHVILVPKYNVDVRRQDYYEARRAQLNAVLAVCETYDLHSSGDRIEDQGAHWYIVRTCGSSWPRFKDDFVTRRYLLNHAEELQDIGSMTPAQLADAGTYCRSVVNPFSMELVKRAGYTLEFERASTDEDKARTLRKAAKEAFGIILY